MVTYSTTIENGKQRNENYHFVCVSVFILPNFIHFLLIGMFSQHFDLIISIEINRSMIRIDEQIQNVSHQKLFEIQIV